jgi:hypothetical protein
MSEHKWWVLEVSSPEQREAGDRILTYGVTWTDKTAEEVCQGITDAAEEQRSRWMFAIDLGDNGALYKLFTPGKPVGDFGNCGYAPVEQIAKMRARCEHLEAGLKVIAAGTVGSPSEEPESLQAVEAFAQSTLDEAPPA